MQFQQNNISAWSQIFEKLCNIMEILSTSNTENIMADDGMFRVDSN
jgi:hypothetical protein